MKIGFVGLGKMGSQMVQRLMGDGHEVVVYDVNHDAVEAMVAHGAEAAADYSELVSKTGDKPTIWLMIPHQFVTKTMEELMTVLPEGSIIIDGGNSDYRQTLKHQELLAPGNIELIDVGTSGGVHGLKNGFSMMVGGSQESLDTTRSLFVTLAQKDGWAHLGRTGAGHFTKMVHNGIEYGIMQAYAEGYRIIKEGPIEDIDLGELAGVWQHGSINESFLNGLIENMLRRDPEFKGVEGYVSESGEARWTLETAKELGIETPVIQASLDVRVDSQQGNINYATKFLAQLRNEFGGHAINKES